MRQSTYDDLVCTTQSVLHHIQMNLDMPLDVDSLARVACFSPFHFQRCFRRLVGEAPIVHVRRIRLERAAYQLRNSKETISSIAADAGFGSLAAFSRAFEESYSVPPSRYRSAPWMFYWQAAPTGVHFQPEGVTEFKPLARRETLSLARIEFVPAFNVLAMHHEGPVDYGKTVSRLLEWLDEHQFDRSNRSLLSFTHEPKKPAQTWKIRGYVAVATDREALPNEPVERHRIDGGLYLIKRFKGHPAHLGDFWARAWNEDLWELRVRQRYATAMNWHVREFDPSAPEDFSVDIYLPVQQPQI